MNVEVEPIYDSSSQLREVRVNWRNQVCSIIIIMNWLLITLSSSLHLSPRGVTMTELLITQLSL